MSKENEKNEKDLKTIDDYYALPDDERVELIDGRFYAMNNSTVIHQAWLGKLCFELAEYVEKNEDLRCRCLPLCVVRLDCDNYTALQPDVMICCKCDRIMEKWIEGAPDFVLEVVSSGSVYLDYHKKLAKYCSAGVREYWIVDPQKETVTVYHFEKSGEPVYYTFADKVPVGIYGEDCEIDFAKLRKKLSYLDEKRR